MNNERTTTIKKHSMMVMVERSSFLLFVIDRFLLYLEICGILRW